MSDRLLVVLYKLHCAANAITPSNKLPPELLRAIFSFLCPGSHRDWEKRFITPYKDLLAVSRVCRHWRETAFSATELWTHILGRSMPVEWDVSIARLCVRRSGGRPLDFSYIPQFGLDPLCAGELIQDCP